MSILKFTICTQGAKSYECNPLYQMDSINTGIMDVCHLGNRLVQLAQLLAFLDQFPDADIQQTIREQLNETAEVKKTGKNTLQYWIPFLYIHEEIC